MALKPLRPCRACQRTLTRTPYCPACSKTHSTRWHGTSAQSRGYDAAWTRLAKQIRKRDKYLCQECLRNGRYKQGKPVDHIVPKTDGGTDDPSNLELLCVPCHTNKTLREAQAGRAANRLA